MKHSSDWSRRDVLRLAAAVPLLPIAHVAGCGDGGSLPEYDYSGILGSENLFQHGVASGDPLADAVILWTHLTSEDGGPLDVFWEIATDAEFSNRVAADWTLASVEHGHTVKLDVAGLQPATTYFFRFRALGRSSAIGRTRTAPRGAVDRMRLAVMSCASLAHGYFHAYRDVAARSDLDAVLHLGDYIYEYGNDEYGAIRTYEPAHEILTLADYRTRYAQYRRDPDLQAAHQQHPFICVWDDHEIANDSWRGGAENHTDPSAAGPNEGPYDERSAAAKQAYAEWMPIRDQLDGRIFRSFAFGGLIDLMMLDTRHWDRDRQTTATDAVTIEDPERTILGPDQEAWLTDQLMSSQARWRFIAQQIVFGPIQVGGSILNPDQWDGYAAARQRVLDSVAQGGSTVILSGDLHSSGAAEIPRDPFDAASYDPETGAGSLAVEFVTPGVTSPAFPPGSNTSVLPQILATNRHIHFADIESRGYMIVDVDADRVQASWFHYTQADIESRRPATPTADTSYVTHWGSNRVTRA